MIKRCLTAALLLLPFGVIADGFPGIQKLMSEKEFEDAGLVQLSDEQIDALNSWLIRYTANDAKIVSQQVKEVRRERDKPQRSFVVGEFDGWTGKTIFRLENGQVWRQRLDGRYRYRGTQPAEVEIRRNALGFYRLQVVGTRYRIGVERIE